MIFRGLGLAHFAIQHMETSPTEMQELVPHAAFPAISELKPGLHNRGLENKKSGTL